jgi:hypothetical protein
MRPPLLKGIQQVDQGAVGAGGDGVPKQGGGGGAAAVAVAATTQGADMGAVLLFLLINW